MRKIIYSDIKDNFMMEFNCFSLIMITKTKRKKPTLSNYYKQQNNCFFFSPIFDCNLKFLFVIVSFQNSE